MMNMMNRMVEGRAHRREIDMLLELTYVSLILVFPLETSTSSTANKSKGARFALLGTLRRGQSKASCAISVLKSRLASTDSVLSTVAYCLAVV
jgi:hypothetical protein